jgi:hypothetical protein
VQAVPHAPQLVLSVCGLMHEPLHSISPLGQVPPSVLPVPPVPALLPVPPDASPPASFFPPVPLSVLLSLLPQPRNEVHARATEPASAIHALIRLVAIARLHPVRAA